MEPLLVFPNTPPPELSQALDLSAWLWKGVDDPDQALVDDGWSGAVVAGDTNLEGALSFCRNLRKRENPLEPVLLLIRADQLSGIDLRDDLFDDFCLFPINPSELKARLHHLFWRTGRGTSPELLHYGPLTLNVETYQAAIDGQPLDLTYMEYELLKFLASRPGKVFTREILLSQVWGYDYYGGARTVDVHVRRLRAKLGEEHANLIHTVRSVGYRFGKSRWEL